MASRNLLLVANACLAAAVLALSGSPRQAAGGRHERVGSPTTSTLTASSRHLSAGHLCTLGFEELAEGSGSYRRENVRLDRISAALGLSVAELEIVPESPKLPKDAAQCHFANASCVVYFGDAEQARAKAGSSVVTVIVDLYPEPKKWPRGSIHVTAGLLQQAGLRKGGDGAYVRSDVEVAELCALLRCSADEFTPDYFMNGPPMIKQYSLSFPGGHCAVELRVKVVKCPGLSGGYRILELRDATEVDHVRISLDAP